jgi:hypothetical protein
MLIICHISSTDEDPGLRIESFAVINLCGVSTNKKYYMFYRHANLQRTCKNDVSIMKALVNYKLSFDWYCTLKIVEWKFIYINST